MDVEKLEQLAAVIVTAGLVAGNFLLFTPWRDGQDPRQHQPGRFMPPNESMHPLRQTSTYLTSMESPSRSPAVGWLRGPFGQPPRVTWMEQLFQQGVDGEAPAGATARGSRLLGGGQVRSDRGQVDGLRVLPAISTAPAGDASSERSAEASMLGRSL